MAYVATNNGTSQGVAGPSKIFGYDGGGRVTRTYVIAGQPTDHALGVTAVVLDGEGALIALDAATGRVLHIDVATGEQSTFAQLSDLPSCGIVPASSGCEPGLQDRDPLPRGAALDRSGNLYVGDAAQGIVWRIPSGGGDAETWLADSRFASGNGIGGIAIDASGAVLLSSPQSLDPNAALGGAIYKIPVEADGTAGTPTLVARFLLGEDPAGLAALNDGSTVVALQGANAVALIGPDGKELHRIEGGEGDGKFDTPTGVALHGETLLITNQAPAARNLWAVLAVGL